jgi:glycosyltransferase involved in cell wall biosynthesis
MGRFHWFESKQLDRVTNYLTRIEILKYAIKNKIEAFYYCTFANRKKYFGLENNIKYLGIFRNKYLKHIEFQILVLINAIKVVLIERESVIMVNQTLIKHMLPALIINQLFHRRNKFISDIRTTPATPNTFKSDMQTFHRQFKYAIKYFDGYSFISPFMEKYLMSAYKKRTYKTVNWSSGVDPALFNPEKFKYLRTDDTFRVLYHGGISKSRGNLNLIKAIKILVDCGYNIELTQIGILVDKDINDYCEIHNLKAWCKILPPIPLYEMPQVIADCDLPVLPFPDFMGWRVSSPIKLMEYLAMGKKVLAPNIECFTNVLGLNSDLCFYYDRYNQDPIGTIADAIKHILDGRLLANGNYFHKIRKFALENYTWEKQASNLFSFCESL